MEPIRIVDATEVGFSGQGGTHVALRYAPINAEAHWWTDTVKPTLPVQAMICPNCRAISLYG